MKTDKDIGSEVKQKLEGYKNSPDPIVWSAIESKLKKKRRKVLFWYFTSGLSTAVIFLIAFYTFDAGNVQDFKPSPQNTTTIESSTSHEDLRHLKIKDSSIHYNYSAVDDILTPSENRTTQNGTKTKGQLIGSNPIPKKNGKTSKMTASSERDTHLQKNQNSTNNINQNSTNHINQKVNPYNTTLKDGVLESDSSTIKKSLFSNTSADTLKNDEALKTNLQEAIDSTLIDKTKKIEPLENEETIKDSLANRQIRWTINPQLIISKYGAFKAQTSNDITTNYGLLLGIRMSEKAFLRFGLRKLNLMNDIDGTKNTVDYLEFPLELKYLIGDKKLNPFITAGFSYFKLEDSTSENENGLEYLDTTASLNFGIGLEHKLLDKFYLNVESNFNYQIKPITTNVDYHPYILSISTGVEYRF
jgi:hypothetical protein